jgi:hypothetical protein
VDATGSFRAWEATTPEDAAGVAPPLLEALELQTVWTLSLLSSRAMQMGRTAGVCRRDEEERKWIRPF